ncbi:MAG: hypothetical protein ABR571_10110 [Jatrophihabitans sp.]|uniref:hypothetical protein n=1 Tax=Jatrophihabitans sp. TaxID=1932789 RepID=UPI0039104AF6
MASRDVPGNSPSAQQCYKGGWQNLVTSTGATFASQDACVAYASHGGVLSPKPTAFITLSPGYEIVQTEQQCAFTFAGGGLLPTSDLYAVFNSSAPADLGPVGGSGDFNNAGIGFFTQTNGPGVYTLYLTGTAVDGTPVISNTVTCTLTG